MLDFTELLPLLDHSEHRSGQELATHFNVTRATIHNCIARIETLGIQVDSVPGRGYRLRTRLDLLDQADIVNNLTPEVTSSLHTIHCMQQVDSTNTQAANLSLPPVSTFSVILAEMQSAGKGRHGRTWVSPYAANIYLSIVWPLQRSLHEASCLSPHLAICVADALHLLGLSKLGLKWPNDVYCDNKKLAGLLIECSGELSGACKMVVGLGVNVAMKNYSNIQIDQQWTDICSNAPNWQLTRNELASLIINALVEGLRSFENKSLPNLVQRWAHWDVMESTSVDVYAGKQTQSGIARGIDDNGCLLLETEQGVERISVGDVTLRGSA